MAASADPSRRGDLLVMYSINDTGVRTHSVIKRSTDQGQTWTTISTLYSPTPGWGIYFGSMYELPQAVAGLPAGTIIAAGNAWDNVNWGNQEVQTFISTDYGVTWTQRGNDDMRAVNERLGYVYRSETINVRAALPVAV